MTSSVKLPRALLLYTVGLLSIFTSCTPPHPVHKKAAPTPTPTATRAYVRDLALAHMTFDHQPDNLDKAKPYVDHMNSIAPSQPTMAPKTMALTVLIIEYEMDSDDSKHSVMVPVNANPDGSYQLDALRQIITSLAPHKPQYNRVQTRTVTVAEPSPLMIKNTAVAEVRWKVDEAYDTIMATAQSLPPLDTANLQLHLTRFFMQQGIRDAAYLTLENSKQKLAQVNTDNPQDAAQVEALAQETVAIENQLHKKLPYKF